MILCEFMQQQILDLPRAITQAITLFLDTFCHKFRQSVTLDLFYNNISGISPAIFT